MAKNNENPMAAAIKEHLDNLAKRDGNFAQAYRKENKSLEECVDYIIGEVRKAGENVVVKSDEEVFGLAVHYYQEDSIKDVKKIPCVTSTSRRKVELTEEERAKLKKEAEEEYKNEIKRSLNEEKPVANSVSDVAEIKVPSMFDF